MQDPTKRGRDLIDAYRRVTVPDAEAQDRGLERLLGREAPPRAGGRVHRLAVAAGVTVLLAAMLLLALRGIASIASPRNEAAPHEAPYQAPPPPERSTVVPPPQARPASRRGPATADAVESETPPHREPQSVSSQPGRRRAPKPQRGEVGPRRQAPSPSPTVPGIGDEARLLADAQAALRDGQASRAIEILAQHSTRFPDGLMQIERESLRAVALCQDNQLEAGVALARRLIAQRPRSRYATRIRRACRLAEAP